MINKVLAIILYMSGLFDSKIIVKKVVWRKNTNKGGEAFINPRWGLYIYIYIYILWGFDLHGESVLPCWVRTAVVVILSSSIIEILLLLLLTIIIIDSGGIKYAYKLMFGDDSPKLRFGRTTYIYIYIYIYTHRYVYIYIYIYAY